MLPSLSKVNKKPAKKHVALMHDLNLPLRAVFVGNTGSGKTQLCVALLLDVYFQIFRAVCAFSPTIEEDDAWDPIDISLFDIATTYTEDKGKKIWEAQAAIPREKRKHILVFYDDNGNRLRKGKHPFVDMFHYASRHKLISKMSCIQDYSFVDPMMRLQDNEVFMWGNSDVRSVDTLRELMGWAVPRREFYEIFRYCTKGDYCPIRLSRRPGGAIAVYRGVGELLIPKTSDYKGLPDAVAREVFSRGIRSPQMVPGYGGAGAGYGGHKPEQLRKGVKRRAGELPQPGEGQAVGTRGEGQGEEDG